MHIKLSGCLGKIQVVFKESADDIQRFIINRIQRFLSENFTYEHVTYLSRKLIDQTANTKAVVTEDIFVRVKDFSDFQGSTCFFIGIRKLHDIVSNIAVGNPGRSHSLRIQHIHKHAGNTVKFLVALCTLKFTDNNNAGIIQGSDKVTCPGRKDIPDGCQSVFVFMLLGFHKKDCTADRRCNVEAGSFVESFHLRIAVQKKVLHKGVFVRFFRIGSKKTFDLADRKFSDGGSGVCGTPYRQKHISGCAV